MKHLRRRRLSGLQLRRYHFRMNKIRVLAVIALSSFALACAELRVLSPSPVVQPPEVGGEGGKFRLESGLLEGEMLEITDNAGNRPPDLSAPDTEDSFYVPLGATVGLGNWADVGMGVFASDLGGGYVRAQIQLIGDGVRRTKAGGFALSIFGRGFYSRGKNEGDQSETFGAGGYPWEATATLFGAEAGASAGYRITDSFMIYAGAARNWQKGTADITQDAANGDPGGAYELEYDGSSDSIQLGLNAEREGTFSLVAGYYQSEFNIVRPRYWSAISLIVQVPVGK